MLNEWKQFRAALVRRKQMIDRQIEMIDFIFALEEKKNEARREVKKQDRELQQYAAFLGSKFEQAPINDQPPKFVQAPVVDGVVDLSSDIGQVRELPYAVRDFEKYDRSNWAEPFPSIEDINTLREAVNATNAQSDKMDLLRKREPLARDVNPDYIDDKGIVKKQGYGHVGDVACINCGMLFSVTKAYMWEKHSCRLTDRRKLCVLCGMHVPAGGFHACEPKEVTGTCARCDQPISNKEIHYCMSGMSSKQILAPAGATHCPFCGSKFEKGKSHLCEKATEIFSNKVEEYITDNPAPELDVDELDEDDWDGGLV